MTSFARTVSLFFVLIALLAGAVAIAYAQSAPPPPPQRGGRGMGPGGGMGMFGPMMLERLNLTADQRSQIQKLEQHNRQQHQAASQQLGDLQRQLRAAVFADGGPDEAAINNLTAQITPLEQQVAANRLAMEKAISQILTQEQRKQLREMPGPGGPGPRRQGPRF